MIEDQYRFLTTADSDMDMILMKNYLEVNQILVITREKGFGGPIRSIFMGSFTPAHIEVFVKKSDYEEAKQLLDYDAFNAEWDAEIEAEIEAEVLLFEEDEAFKRKH
jgi:hypothetical protein